MEVNRIGITMGDPAGIGPEIIVKTLHEMSPEARSRSIVVGNVDFLERASRMIGAQLKFSDSLDVDDGVVPVIHVPTTDSEAIKDGEVSASAGEAAYRYVEKSVELSLEKLISVIVTAPLNKAAMHLAGHKYDGHTELLADLTGAKASFMLLAGPKLNAIHVSTHTSLANAATKPTIQRVLDTIRIGDRHFKSIGYESPRLAVAGLNPHCGEGGLFGSEEADRLVPAITQAKSEGIDVQGPISGDTVFYRALEGEFDLVVAQYHDQGHIPTKLIAFNETVNVSLGLPIYRTSVDHGTAFDIAWNGVANNTNMKAAIEYARRIAGS
ncbi:4-hydroxythreonine-4-phosphate dehydrogenase PdxA [Burkholderiales bacterium]|nr:4-hydroxythreonine-4-phosphate dehydrogenase PdxA [Burkholderiales bacterium]MDA9994151.1 4-hydroxythreonine-4-phosphate dehydrogenase PdxA [Burkholderiales bacterium]